MKNENKFLKSSAVLTHKPVVCVKCGHGENNAVFNKAGVKIGATGGATLRKIKDDYVCTDCNKTKLLPRRQRRYA